RDCLGNLVISGPNLPKPLAFGAAAAILDACEAGPDGAVLSAARAALTEAGTEFSLIARTKDNRAVSVCGKPIGGHAVLLLDRERTETTAEEPRQTKPTDYCGLLEALPIPAWIRAANMKLVFVNRAFLEFT